MTSSAPVGASTGDPSSRVDETCGLFDGFAAHEVMQVWMSHGDHVDAPPHDYVATASSASVPIAAMRHRTKPIHCVQFHPEVAHTPRGGEIISNFLFRVCKAEPSWTPGAFVESEVAKIKQLVGDARVICGLSGGVDSSVAAALVHRAIGDQLTCVFVDTGLLRLHEREQVERTFRANLGIRLITVDAAEQFLERLAGVEEPEKKRTIIGHTFIDVFESTTDSLRAEGEYKFLVQGTLYPDVIESFSPRGGPSVTIKTHHNVGGLKPDMKFKLIEPLRELFKDEVRNVGRELGLPEEMVGRHPFPGPGLGIRVLGPVDRAALDVLQEGRRDLSRGDSRRRAVRRDLAGVRRLVAGPQRGRDGRLSHLRERGGAARRDEHGRHDGGLVSFPARLAGKDLDADYQSGPRRESRRLRHQLQAAGDDRVGVRRRRAKLTKGEGDEERR